MRYRVRRPIQAVKDTQTRPSLEHGVLKEVRPAKADKATSCVICLMACSSSNWVLQLYESNAFIEWLNGKFRAECLSQNWFLSLADARGRIESWRMDYNHYRPNSPDL